MTESPSGSEVEAAVSRVRSMAASYRGMKSCQDVARDLDVLLAEVERQRALVRRLSDNLGGFVREHPDPGAEALGALWEAGHAASRAASSTEARAMCADCVDCSEPITDTAAWVLTGRGPLHTACYDPEVRDV